MFDDDDDEDDDDMFDVFGCAFGTSSQLCVVDEAVGAVGAVGADASDASDAAPFVLLPLCCGLGFGVLGLLLSALSHPL